MRKLSKNQNLFITLFYHKETVTKLEGKEKEIVFYELLEGKEKEIIFFVTHRLEGFPPKLEAFPV